LRLFARSSGNGFRPAGDLRFVFFFMLAFYC